MDSYKVASILHDIEDDLIIITVEERVPTVLGVPCDVVMEAFEITVGVRCVFEEEDLTSEPALVISSYIGDLQGTVSSAPLGEEDDRVVLSV